MAWLQGAEDVHWAAYRELKTDEERERAIAKHDAAISAYTEQSDKEAWESGEWDNRDQVSSSR
mgnify:CR=1 FL=1|jgi:hypothetical protein